VSIRLIRADPVWPAGIEDMIDQLDDAESIQSLGDCRVEHERRTSVEPRLPDVRELSVTYVREGERR
jgi:hypothetical protein